MPNPFPGMNPYLENPAFWRDVHTSIIVYARETIQSQIRPRYRVVVEERVYIEVAQRHIYPNITIVKPTILQPFSESAVAVLEYDAPAAVLTVTDEPIQEPYLVIVERDSGKVVTVIEVLSHSNKTLGNEGYRLYRQKQQEILQSDVNLVEIDLLRVGEYVLLPPEEAVRERFDKWHYFVSIRQVKTLPSFALYPVTVRQRLPRIFIPLAPNDERVAVLDLQAVIDRCYEAGAYDDFIDYRSEPPPPAFNPEDAAWIDELLKSKGLR
ncbi:MAG: DUF4058 family protein [Armatimonadetes bacterium]|nr:DUF4058 family protein [Armatimonadota bacterium]MDW8028826.1 DUF4058 family protein [Armatimonadota bacterium]